MSQILLSLKAIIVRRISISFVLPGDIISTSSYLLLGSSFIIPSFSFQFTICYMYEAPVSKPPVLVSRQQHLLLFFRSPSFFSQHQNVFPIFISTRVLNLISRRYLNLVFCAILSNYFNFYNFKRHFRSEVQRIQFLISLFSVSLWASFRPFRKFSLFTSCFPSLQIF